MIPGYQIFLFLNNTYNHSELTLVNQYQSKLSEITSGDHFLLQYLYFVAMYIVIHVHLSHFTLYFLIHLFVQIFTITTLL